MKYIALNLLIVIACSACSEGDFELGLEKQPKSEPPITQSSEPHSTENSSSSKPVPAKPEPEITKPTVAAQTGIALNTVRTPLSKQPSNFEVNTEAVTDTASSTDNATEFAALDASLSQIDDATLMQHYGPMGSGIAFDPTSRGIALEESTIALQVSKRNLVSNVSSVSGATSINGAPDGFGFTIALSGDYLFEFDKDTLTPKAQTSLNSVLVLYQEYQGEQIKIAGHTDAKGSQEYNQDLSERRATSVKQWFVAAGINETLISTVGHGETQPIAPNTKNGQDYPQGRAQNRRVDIQVSTKKKVNHLPTVSEQKPLN